MLRIRLRTKLFNFNLNLYVNDFISVKSISLTIYLGV
jgi:hypothetical protein